MAVDYTLRLATLDDVPAIRELIARSIHGLGAADYTRAQIEAALAGAFGVDTALIRDGTYFVAATRARDIVGCGGWGRRRTLFGSDTRTERDESWLDPKSNPAKIRAFFVDPAHARHGIGRALLARSEAEALRAGFSSLQMMATLPGMRLYQKFGYVPGPTIDYPLAGALTIRFVPMCVASSISGQTGSVKMGDFDLLQAACRGSEVNEQTRASTIYGGAEIGGFARGGSAWGSGERGMPASRFGAVGLLSLACGGPGRFGRGVEAGCTTHAA